MPSGAKADVIPLSLTLTSPTTCVITLTLIWPRGLGLRCRQVNSHTDCRYRFKDRRHHPHLVLETRKVQRKKAPGQGTSPPHFSARLTCIPSSFGCWVALAPQCLPMHPPQSTSLQAFHPKAPKHVYQNQLRVCADLFLIAGAWFTLAPPPQY